MDLYSGIASNAANGSAPVASSGGLTLATLRLTNSKYTLDLWKRFDALMQGGDALKPYMTHFLPRNPTEPEGTYRDRVHNAQVAYENNLASIISNKDNGLFAYPFEIRPLKPDGSPIANPDSYYQQFIEDCTGVGTNLNDFMRSRFTEALTFGASYWLLEKPRLPQAPKSLREWEEVGAGNCTVKAVHCCDLLDWMEQDGILQWAVIHNTTTFRKNPRSSQLTTRETFSIYDQETVSVYQLEYDPSKKPEADAKVPMIDSYAHGFSGVPLMCLRMPKQLTVIPLCGDLQILHFQMSFALSWAMKRFCYPIGVLKCDTNSDLRDANKGHYLVIGENDSFTFESPDPSGFESQGSHIKSIKDEIFRICAQSNQAQDMHLNGAVSRSADSKEIDTAVSEQSLNRCGAIVRESVQTTFEWITAARGEDIKWSVTGLDRFAIALRGNNIEDLEAGIVSLKDSPTAVLELRAQLSQKLLHDVPQETKMAIRKELEAAPAPTDPIPTLPPPVINAKDLSHQ